MRGLWVAPVAFVALCITTPLDAQYQRGVLVHHNDCRFANTVSVTTSEGAQFGFRLPESGVRTLAATSGVLVTVTKGDPGAVPRSVRTSSGSSSVRVSGTVDAQGCGLRTETISTDELVAWAKTNADDAERERRRWGRIRNVLFLGGAAIVGATLYNFNNEVDRDGEGDAVTLLAGSALGLTVTYLGFNQAQPEVSDYRARELRFRALEREITQRAR